MSAGRRKAHDACRERLLATNCQSAHQWRLAQILRAPMTVPARDVMLRIERPIERPEAADEEESPCPPPERELLLSMFRVLKDLHLYCEESGRGELVAEVVDALSMCTADFTALATRLRDRRPDERLPLVPPLARVQTSPLAARALGGGGGGDASVLSSPASLSSSPRWIRQCATSAREPPSSRNSA